MKFLVEYKVLGFVTAPKFFKQDDGVFLSDGGSLSALKQHVSARPRHRCLGNLVHSSKKENDS